MRLQSRYQPEPEALLGGGFGGGCLLPSSPTWLVPTSGLHWLLAGDISSTPPKAAHNMAAGFPPSD